MLRPVFGLAVHRAQVRKQFNGKTDLFGEALAHLAQRFEFETKPVQVVLVFALEPPVGVRCDLPFDEGLIRSKQLLLQLCNRLPQPCPLASTGHLLIPRQVLDDVPVQRGDFRCDGDLVQIANDLDVSGLGPEALAVAVVAVVVPVPPAIALRPAAGEQFAALGAAQMPAQHEFGLELERAFLAALLATIAVHLEASLDLLKDALADDSLV